MLTETLIDAKRSDWTIPQNWARFTPAEHRVWDLLFARQSRALEGRAVADFFRGLDVLRLSKPGIPDFEELNERLFARTGWTVVSVPGLVPDEIFFAHLAARRFPAGNFIRGADSLDYIEQPDVFHDVFGHVPLLALPAVADFMQAMGEAGLAAGEAGALHRLARLYWYSVEFGLARESETVRRSRFELSRVLRTRYRSDSFQRAYFILDGLGDLPRLLEEADLGELYRGLAEVPDLEP
jgi:phenylalanine-4-hydroxylase